MYTALFVQWARLWLDVAKAPLWGRASSVAAGSVVLVVFGMMIRPPQSTMCPVCYTPRVCKFRSE